MRKYKFISTLRFLDIAEPLDSSFSIMPGIEIITDKDEINKIVDDNLLSAAGNIEVNHLLNANHIIYCEADNQVFHKAENSHQALLLWLLWIDMIISDSWLIKDNAIACEVAYCNITDGIYSEWSNNYLSHPVSLACGERHKTVEFTIKELNDWESKSHTMQSYLHSNNSGTFASFTSKNYSRIGRARQFLAAARKVSHPAIKLSHYCTAFESLFSTDNAELSHKLSERVALFLKISDFDPFEVFNHMKQFYAIRSKVTHGDSIQPAKEEELSALSQQADLYLRFIFNSIIEDNKQQELFDGKKNEFENYFKQLLFS